MTSPAARTGGVSWLAMAAVLVVLVGGAWLLRDQIPGMAAGGTGPTLATFAVARGPLSIQVVETGTIQAREQLTIKSDVEGQTTLLFLIPEGTLVKQGDLLAQLDGSKLTDDRVDQQIRTQNAESSFISARETLELKKSEAASNISKDTLALQFAREDLRKYLEGDYPNQLKESEARITLAEAELKRAAQKLEWSRILSGEKYVSDTELQADELAARKAQLDLELAQSALQLLRDFTFARSKTTYESNVQQAELTLKRTQLKASADLVQAEADLKAKEVEFQRQQGKLQKIEQQLEKTRILAPRDGLVVYATSSGGGGFRGGDPLAEGQTVRERQELIKLPTADAMMAEVKIHESRLDKVRPGLPVRITVDALPGREFTGKVMRISPLPDASNMWMNPDLKVYPTEIHIDQAGEGLRTGMSCQAQILVAEFPDALAVPVQAVIRQGPRALVYVLRDGKPEPREVQVGMDNNRMVHLQGGVQEGELVLLAPPLDAAVRETSAPARGGPPSNQLIGEALSKAGSGLPNGGNPAGNGGPPANTAPGNGAGKMSAEDREAWKKKMEAMTPEEREKWREMNKGRSGRGDGTGESK